MSPYVELSPSAVYAAPFDALAYNGMQINGSMEVNQEGAGTGINGAYFCDGWILYKAGTMAVNSVQGNLYGYVPGLPFLASVSTSTAQTSLGAGDYVSIGQPMEAARISRLNMGKASAQPFTVAFWSSHDITGTYSVVIRGGSPLRSCAMTYTQAAAGVPQYNAVTFPGDTATASTWAFNNAAGMWLDFTFAAGTNIKAPAAGAWYTGNYIAAPGQVNGVATTAGYFRITGVVILPGIEAPSAARSAFITRPYDQELLTCQRYWRKLTIAYSGYKFAGAGVSWATVLSPLMRADPTVVSISNSHTNVDGTVTYLGTADYVYANFAPATSGGYIFWSVVTANARL